MKKEDKNIIIKELSEKLKKKRADIVITTNCYKIITEQKFAMLNISLQDTIFDLEKVDIWLETYVQAIEQLRETEKQIDKENKIVVKLILFFDDLFIADGLVKERIVKLYKQRTNGTTDLNNVFMIEVGDFEALVHLIACNEVLLNKIMSEKIQRDNNNDNSKGVEFNQLFQEYGVEEEDYITTKRIFGLDQD